jgi:hypothetical protein
MLTSRIEAMEVIVKRITPLIPQVVAQFQQKAVERMQDALGLAGHGNSALTRQEALERIRQEVTLYGIRIDVSEELSRLSAHLTETRHILKKGGQVGKRLDFMMQELNREANTLGAKASVKELADASMELKLLIEQMREQVQNLESWAEKTPDDFVFAVKASRYATNRKVLGEAGESIERFIDSGLTELGDKLGPLLWQLAGTKQFDADDVEAFFKLLPAKLGTRKLQPCAGRPPRQLFMRRLPEAGAQIQGRHRHHRFAQISQLHRVHRRVCLRPPDGRAQRDRHRLHQAGTEEMGRHRQAVAAAGQVRQGLRLLHQRRQGTRQPVRKLVAAPHPATHMAKSTLVKSTLVCWRRSRPSSCRSPPPRARRVRARPTARNTISRPPTISSSAPTPASSWSGPKCMATTTAPRA